MDTWDRRTTLVDHATSAPPDVLAAVEASTYARGIEWTPASVTLCWATTATTTSGRLRKITRTVTTVGFLGPETLTWTIAQDGGAPAAMVARRSRIDVADGTTAVAGLSPELAARVRGADTDGVTVRGDLGGRELGSVFIGLGRGPDADVVRAALLAPA